MESLPGLRQRRSFRGIATQEIGTDTVAMRRTDPVRFIEVMGRDAGWLAGSAMLGKRDDADAPHIILLPEHPLAPDEILSRIQEIHRQLGYAVHCVCQNQPSIDGAVLGSELGPEFGLIWPPIFASGQLSGSAGGCRDRIAGTGGSLRPAAAILIALRSEVDATEAEALGAAAVTRGLAGETDVMLTLKRISSSPYRWEIEQTALETIANQQRLLPADYIGADGVTLTSAFADYALPLIGDLNERHHRYI